MDVARASVDPLDSLDQAHVKEEDYGHQTVAESDPFAALAAAAARDESHMQQGEAATALAAPVTNRPPGMTTVGIMKNTNSSTWLIKRVLGGVTRRPSSQLGGASAPNMIAAAIKHDVWLLTGGNVGLTPQQARERGLNFDLGVHEDPEVIRLLEGTDRDSAFTMLHGKPNQGRSGPATGPGAGAGAWGGEAGTADAGGAAAAAAAAGWEDRGAAGEVNGAPGLPAPAPAPVRERQPGAPLFPPGTIPPSANAPPGVRVIGVKFDRQSGRRWTAERTVNGKAVRAGSHPTQVDAAIAIDLAMLKNAGLTAQEARDRGLNYDLGAHSDARVGELLEGTVKPNLDKDKPTVVKSRGAAAAPRSPKKSKRDRERERERERVRERDLNALMMQSDTEEESIPDVGAIDELDADDDEFVLSVGKRKRRRAAPAKEVAEDEEEDDEAPARGGRRRGDDEDGAASSDGEDEEEALEEALLALGPSRGRQSRAKKGGLSTSGRRAAKEEVDIMAAWKPYKAPWGIRNQPTVFATPRPSFGGDEEIDFAARAAEREERERDARRRRERAQAKEASPPPARRRPPREPTPEPVPEPVQYDRAYPSLPGPDPLEAEVSTEDCLAWLRYAEAWLASAPPAAFPEALDSRGFRSAFSTARSRLIATGQEAKLVGLARELDRLARALDDPEYSAPAAGPGVGLVVSALGLGPEMVVVIPEAAPAALVAGIGGGGADGAADDIEAEADAPMADDVEPLAMEGEGVEVQPQDLGVGAQGSPQPADGDGELGGNAVVQVNA